MALLLTIAGATQAAETTKMGFLPASASTKASEGLPATHRDTIRSIRVNQAPGNKKYKIKLYPDAKRQVLFFSATGEGQKIYQLYMFDMDGKLVNQTSIRNRETTVLTNIAEGNYLFEVFSNDQRIVNGQLTVD